MKKIKLLSFVSLAALCLATFTSCEKETPFDSAQTSDFRNKRVSSAGNITVAGGGSFEELGAKTTYTFNAIQQHNGKTTGHLILQFRAADSRMYVKIDCLRLFGDNKATMSGIITTLTQSANFPPPPFIFVGGRVSFTV